MSHRVRNRVSGRRVCFVTGTRAEFGLMRRTLAAIDAAVGLKLQLIVTGTHLDPACGQTIDEIRQEKFKIDAIVDWDAKAKSIAGPTGLAMSRLAGEFDRLKSEVVMVVGDRVEAFAAAVAGSLSGRVVVHIHGGERATGQIDDTLRHAISRLSHVHLCATTEARRLLIRTGEDAWRVTKVGAPGLDGIRQDAIEPTLPVTTSPDAKRIAFLMHPWVSDDTWNRRFASELLAGLAKLDCRLVALMPNGDPGSHGIRLALQSAAKKDQITLVTHLNRAEFLGLVRGAAVMVGNSSSGIIEAASFGTRVIDIGPRQFGRFHGANVTRVEADVGKVVAAVRKSLGGVPIKLRMVNPYGDGRTAARVVKVLRELTIGPELLSKTIAY